MGVLLGIVDPEVMAMIENNGETVDVVVVRNRAPDTRNQRQDATTSRRST